VGFHLGCSTPLKQHKIGMAPNEPFSSIRNTNMLTKAILLCMLHTGSSFKNILTDVMLNKYNGSSEA